MIDFENRTQKILEQLKRQRAYLTVFTIYLSAMILFLSPGCGNEKIKSTENMHTAHSQNHHPEKNDQNETGEPSISKSRTPTFAFDIKGKLWSAWAFGKHVYVSFSDNEGKTFSNPVKVNKVPQEIASNGENRPKVIAAKNGNIYISYSISLKEKYTGLVKFSHSIDGGKTFSEPVTINDDTAVAGHGFESLGVSEDGTIYLFWLDSRLSRLSKKEGKEYNGSSIFYTYSEDNGKTFKPNKKIADHICQCCRIALDFDENFPVIIYRDIINDNIRDHSLIKFANKESFTKPKRVTFENWKIDGCPHHGPSLHIDDEGIYHLTWFNMEDNKGKIFYARSDNKGDSFEYKKRIGGKTVSHPSIQGNKNTLIITWLEFNEKNNSVKKTVSADGGKTWKDEEEIFSFMEYCDHPFLIKKKNEIFSAGKSAHEIYLTSLY